MLVDHRCADIVIATIIISSVDDRLESFELNIVVRIVGLIRICHSQESLEL